MKKDNSGIMVKIKMRSMLLKELPSARILESHGGVGRIYSMIYSGIEKGVVFEKDKRKAEILMRQRPKWSVYCGDCVPAISKGVGFHVEPNFFDIDPYGEPWPVIFSIFENSHRIPDKWCMVVNDGLRQKLQMGGGWSVKSMKDEAKVFGSSNMAKNYHMIVEEKISNLCEMNGFDVKKWAIHYSGRGKQMTHYAGVFMRQKP